MNGRATRLCVGLLGALYRGQGRGGEGVRARRRALQACEIGDMCVCVVAARARGRVRGACAHLRHSSSTSSSVEQRKEEVDPAGLKVRGEGDGPHPANRCARPHAGHVRAGAPSLAHNRGTVVARVAEPLPQLQRFDDWFGALQTRRPIADFLFRRNLSPKGATRETGPKGKASMGFTLLSRSYYYLRRRSPGPPFPPDHRQAGERWAIM